MRFDSPLISGVLVKRYKRFLADVTLPDHGPVTVHCPNTGSMMGCAEPDSPVWLSRSASKTRKYPYTWEIVQAENTLVGINTSITNRLVEEAIGAGVIDELQGYQQIRREIPIGSNGSRADLLLTGDGGERCYIEIKNVTLADGEGTAMFPDAVSQRATKHLHELMTAADSGHRAVLCFCVQRDDAEVVRPADSIDAVYGRTLRQAMDHGVEVIAYRARVAPEHIALYRRLPVECP